MHMRSLGQNLVLVSVLAGWAATGAAEEHESRTRRAVPRGGPRWGSSVTAPPRRTPSAPPRPAPRGTPRGFDGALLAQVEPTAEPSPAGEPPAGEPPAGEPTGGADAGIPELPVMSEGAGTDETGSGGAGDSGDGATPSPAPSAAADGSTTPPEESPGTESAPPRGPAMPVEDATAPPAERPGTLGPPATTPSEEPAAPDGGKLTIHPQSPFHRQRVDIMEGDIPVVEFLRFLADYTGLPLIVDTGAQANALQSQMITIAAPILGADAEIVKAILENNRWLVFQETLPSGTEIINVKPAQAATAAGEPPRNVPLVQVGPGGASRVTSKLEAELGIRDDELATMIFSLSYTPPTDAINTLNNLVGAAAGGRPGAAARNQAFSVVEVKDTNMLIVTAKFGLLDYIQKLLSIIDVEIKEPERIVDIIRVEEADASELSSIIDEFLGQRGTTGARGRTRSTIGLRRAPTPAPAGAAPGSAPAATGSRTSLADEYPTQLIPDLRSNKIIVITYSPSDLEDIHMLVRELDTKFDIRRLRTRIYRMNFLKAEEIAPVIESLITGSAAGLSGQRGLGSRTSRLGSTSRLPRVSQAGARASPATPTTPGAAGGAPLPTTIVAHEETNSLIIQAEAEEYEEILHILSKIDIRRRQVFLEAALVQVSTSSALNYTIELMAGNPDDEDLRALFASSFGLSGIDIENWTRILPDVTEPPPGGLLAVMNRGKFPALVSFFKASQDSQVLATPFILADDNEASAISITETRFVVNTSTVNTATTTSQQGEEAGITLDILPRITSENSLFLELSLEVSDFGQASTQDVLPPKTSNSVASAVTVPDERIYVIGGLTRENKAKTVSKLPLLGDIPLIGKLFRSEATSNSQSNLYVFLRAHILTDPEFRDLFELSQQAEEQVRKFAPEMRASRFQTPDVGPAPQEEIDYDAARKFQLHPIDEETGLRYESSRRSPAGQDYRGDLGRPTSPESRPLSSFAEPQQSATGRPGEEEDEGTLPTLDELNGGLPRAEPRDTRADVSGVSTPPTAGGTTRPEDGQRGRLDPPETWRDYGVEYDPEGESWFVPLKRPDGSGSRTSKAAPRDESQPVTLAGSTSSLRIPRENTRPSENTE